MNEGCWQEVCIHVALMQLNNLHSYSLIWIDLCCECHSFCSCCPYNALICTPVFLYICTKPGLISDGTFIWPLLSIWSIIGTSCTEIRWNVYPARYECHKKAKYFEVLIRILLSACAYSSQVKTGIILQADSILFSSKYI